VRTTYPAAIFRRALPASIVVGLSLAVLAAPGPVAGAKKPRAGDLRCLAQCAGPRKAAVGGQVRISGSHLAKVVEVRFHGVGGAIAAPPDAASHKRLLITVPAGATSGRLRVVTANGSNDASTRPLRVVDASDLPTRARVRSASVRPHRAYFDGRPKIRLRYSFSAANRSDIVIQVVRGRTGKVVRRWRLGEQRPFARHRRVWNALESDGDVADDGRYRFRVGEAGERLRRAGSLVLHGYRFPVRGAHGYGGYLQSFGAPRSGGRRHQGQDVYAGCGTPLEAARGGRIQTRGNDARLYGHYVVIDDRKSSADHMYAHLASRSPLHQGQRVRTGQRIGRVGKTGNARTTPCHLHFEIWPHGRRNGSPIDPKPSLRRWDKWS
jgi:murein DD-endopeptidase MepM/ murein hydrolase activator NlpD